MTYFRSLRTLDFFFFFKYVNQPARCIKGIKVSFKPIEIAPPRWIAFIHERSNTYPWNILSTKLLLNIDETGVF